jgi:hypothetical protein
MKYSSDSAGGAALAGGDNGVGGGVVTEVDFAVVLVMGSERETRTSVALPEAGNVALPDSVGVGRVCVREGGVVVDRLKWASVV